MSPSQDQIIEAVQAFVTAATWAESKQIVEARRDVLLTDAADEVLANLLAQYKEDENATRILEQHRALLSRCRREGIEAAFADLVAPGDPSTAVPKPIVEAVLAFVNAQTWSESKEIVEAHRDVLLTNAADEVLVGLLEQYKDNEDATRQLEEHRALLARCRGEGIDAAFADHVPPPAARRENELDALLQELGQLTKPSDMPRAVAVCQAALELVDPETQRELWAALQGQLGNSLAQNPLGDRAQNLEDAIKHYELALQVRTPTTFPQDCRNTAYSLGNLLYDEGRFAEARTQFTTAHDAVEALRGEVQREGARRDLAEQNAVLYSRLVHCCLLRGDEEAAFKYAVAGKGRAFVDMLATARFGLSAAGADDPELAEDLRKAKELRQQLDNLWAQLRGEGGPSTPNGTERRSRVDMRADHRALQDREDTFWNDMAYKHPSLTATQRAPALTAREARKLAGRLGATLVEYYRHEDGWCAFVVTPNGMRHVPLPGVDDELLGLMFRWLGRIELPAGHENKQSHERSSRWLRRLHEAFIAPLRSYLPREGKVVLAPFAHLHLLPLGAALNPATGHYAVDDYGLAFAPNLAALRVALDQVSRTEAAPGRQTPERLLSVAYPGAPNSRDYLPNVVPEARAAAHHFDPWATLLHEEAATPDAVLANARGQDVVHLGCHGSFNPETPGRSGLMLSGGWLTVQRIINELRLDRTKLAIIAACLSGRIGLRQGEEHVGLVQAMMSAKARAVVASLWQVDDAATRALFEAFYAGIKAGDSPAKALADAAREVRSRPGWEHPYYWAAFQVSGLAHGANGSGLAQWPDDVESGIEEAYHDSMERSRGGLAMDAKIVVENSLALLESIGEDLDEIRATLDPAERDRMVARLHELDKQAAGVQTADELLALAGAVHGFVEETPALADFRSEKVDAKAAERSRFKQEDFEESPEAQYVQEKGTGIRNHLRELLWNLEESSPESNNDN